MLEVQLHLTCTYSWTSWSGKHHNHFLARQAIG